MTVNTNDSRVSYNGDGVTTQFPVSFYFLKDTDLVVFVDGIQKELTTDYSVVGAGNAAGGSVTFVAPPPVATGNVVIIRDPDQLQSISYPPNDPFPAKTHETALDKLTMLVQRTRDLIGRAFTFNDADTSGASLSVPSPQAGHLIGWNAAGTGLANYANIGDGSGLALPVSIANGGTGVTTAAAALAALGALSSAAGAVGSTNLANASVTAAKLAPDLIYAVPQGRLTLTTGTPVTIADVTGAATVYFTPYKGDKVPIFDGTSFAPRAFTELSQTTIDTTKSPAAVANNSNYDFFVWDDNGTLRCTRGPTWAAGAVAGSDTARGTGAGSTELQLQNGIYLNKNAIANGPAALRGTFVGSIRSNGTATVDDSLTRRCTWNMYNRIKRAMHSAYSASRSTTSTTFVELNTEIRLNFLVGLAEDGISFNSAGSVQTSGAISDSAATSIAFDGTTAEDAYSSGNDNSATVQSNPLAVCLEKMGLLGFHYATLVGKISVGTSTALWPGGAPGVLRCTFGAKLQS